MVLFQPDEHRPHLVDDLLADVKSADTVKAQKPLVTVGGKKVGADLLHVGRKSADRLNAVHAKKKTVLAAQGSNRLEVCHGSGGVLGGAHGDETGSRLKNRFDGLGRYSAFRCGNGIDHDAAMGQVLPDVDVRRVLDLGGDGDPVALLPIDPLGDQGESVRGVPNEGDFVRGRTDELGEPFPAGFTRVQPTRLGQDGLLDMLVEPLVDGCPYASRCR